MQLDHTEMPATTGTARSESLHRDGPGPIEGFFMGEIWYLVVMKGQGPNILDSAKAAASPSGWGDIHYNLSPRSHGRHCRSSLVRRKKAFTPTIKQDR